MENQISNRRINLAIRIMEVLNEWGIKVETSKRNRDNLILEDPETGKVYYLRSSGYVSSKPNRYYINMGTVHNQAETVFTPNHGGYWKRRHKLLKDPASRLMLALETIHMHREKMISTRTLNSIKNHIMKGF